MKKVFFLTVIALCFIQNKSFAQLVVSNDTTICAGQSAQLSVTGGSSYSWTPSNTLSSSSSSTPLATPTQTTTYIVSSPLTNINIAVNGNFSLGDTGFTSSYIYQLPPNNAGQGRYWVGSTPNAFSSGMSNCSDHTGGNGNMLIANAAQTINTPVWCQTLPVNSNSTYTLTGWVTTLNQTNLPKARWMVNGTPIGSTTTTFFSCIWQSFTATWNSGSNTVATFCAFDVDTNWNGNDFAMDDFSIVGSGTQYDTVTVTVVNSPQVNLGNDTSICGAINILLNAQNPGSSYLWNDNTTSQTKLVSAAGMYSVTVTGSNTCSATSDILITSSSPTTPVLTATDTLICSSDTAQICANGSFVSYLWNTGFTTTCIYASLAGNYYVTATDANGCTAESNHMSISVYPAPSVSISVNGDTLSSYGAVTYQWYFNGNQITGANFNSHIATQSGNYSVLISDTNGCNATSTNIFITTGWSDLFSDNLFKLYPNPLGNEKWNVETDKNTLGSKLEIFDSAGKLVYETFIAETKSAIELNILPGFYSVKLTSADKNYQSKFVKL